MPNLYQKSDIKNPKNAFVYASNGLSLDSRFQDFQKFVYTVQLAEQIFMKKRLEDSGEKMVVWVRDTEKFKHEKDRLEEFFSSFFEYDVNFEIKKDSTNPIGYQQQFEEPNYDFISLFSGGLDSGTYALDSINKKKKGLLHHTITNERPFGDAKELFEKHLQHSGLIMTSTRVENKVTQPMYLKTRGLIFLTNLLCVAAQLKIPKAIIPENGPFMANISVSPSAEPTRTTDPFMVQEWTKIFKKITDSKVTTETPYYHKTKSEVILQGENNKIIEDTWSCSHFQGLSKMCGLCNSCLVRILSCYAIEEGENIEQSYKTNPFLVPFSTLKLNDQNSYRISLDAIDFWAGIIEPKISRNSIERDRFKTIRDNYPVFLEHAVDMFLGFRNIAKKYDSKEPLFVQFKAKLKRVDGQKIKCRSNNLQQIKEEKWS